MRAIGFDLGNTLVEYAGVPLNWEKHYPAALRELAACLGTMPTGAEIDAASAVLRRFNTRLNPRESEVTFGAILAELLPCLESGAAATARATPKPRQHEHLARDPEIPRTERPCHDEQRCAEAFFRVFQQQLRPFPDAAPSLANLRERGLRIGVFTDVPYAMPRSLVLRDVADAGLDGRFDVLITSCDAGCRKPAPAALRSLADALGCGAADMAYIGDEPKDIEAARRFGCTAILLDRSSHGSNFGQDRTIRTLTELPAAIR